MSDTLGGRIAKARRAGGKTQEWLSEQLGVNRGTVNGWENPSGNPPSRQLANIAELFGVSGHWLLSGEGMMYDVTSSATRAMGRIENVLGDYIEEAGSRIAAPESGDRVEDLINTPGVIPWIADAEMWNFTFVGEQAEVMLGYPIEQWYENDFWAAHIHEEDRVRVIAYCMERSQAVGDYVFDYRMVKADGGTIWLRDFVGVDALNGVPVTIRGFMFDISDTKEDEEAERLRPRAPDPDETPNLVE
jgi:PAS domain S-box-containing protein